MISTRCAGLKTLESADDFGHKMALLAAEKQIDHITEVFINCSLDENSICCFIDN